MLLEIQKRINRLELTINFLEDMISRYRHLYEPKTIRHLQERVNLYKEELRIRRDSL